MNRSLAFALLAGMVFVGVGDFPRESSARSLDKNSRQALEALEPTLSPPIRLNPNGPFLVSPQASPDGKWIRAFGRKGMGLFVIPADGIGSPSVLDGKYRGPARWISDKVALVFGHDDIRQWVPGKGVSPGQKPSDSPKWGEDFGRFLGRGPIGAFYHHPKLGTVTLVLADGGIKERGDGQAWGARLAPGKSLIAWCTGNLANPHLFVWIPSSEKVVDLGTGAYPAWFPDGQRLVFARPLEVTRVNGKGVVRQSELWFWALASNGPVRLNTEVGRTPMEPWVGPEGRYIFYSDWLDGALYRVSLSWQGGKP